MVLLQLRQRHRSRSSCWMLDILLSGLELLLLLLLLKLVLLVLLALLLRCLLLLLLLLLWWLLRWRVDHELEALLGSWQLWYVVVRVSPPDVLLH